MADPAQHLGSRNQIVFGIVLALLAAIGFSAKAILVKLAYRHPVDAVTLLALRMSFSVPFFLAAALWSHHRDDAQSLELKDWGAILGLGFVGYYLSSLLDFLGLQYISAGLERLVLFLYPTIVVILSALFLNRPLGRQEMVAMGLSYAGIVLVFVHDFSGVHGSGMALGAGLVFASTLTYSIYLIGVGQVITRIGTIRFTSYAMTVASVVTLMQFAFTHPMTAMRQPISVYTLGLSMAIISTVLPVFMLSASIRLIGSGQASLLGTIGPVSTIFMAQAFLGEVVSLPQAIGSVLVMAGVALIGRRSLNPKKQVS